MTPNPFTTILRRLQGERPGMGSELVMPDRHMEMLAIVSNSPTIQVAQTVLCLDVSFWQGDIDFSAMEDAGAAGVIIRAGQRTWADSRFSENWSKAAAADLPRGSYWFYDSREDPKRQAALWWSLIKDDPGELVHAADFEESYGGPYGKPEHFETFLNEFRWLSKLPVERVAIYTAYYWWLERVGVALEFQQYPLWLAWYADASVVRIPGPWDAEDLLFWQFTSSGDGTKYGVSSQEIDLSWYCCSLVHFNNRFDLGGSTPPDGGNMALYEGTGKLTSTPFVRVRKPNADGSLNADGMTIGQINPGQPFKANGIAKDSMLRDWLHITEVGGKPIDGWSAAWLLDYVVVPTDPPGPVTYADVPYIYTITLGGDPSPYELQTITGNGTIKVKP